LFGEDHPYGKEPGEDEIRSLTRDQLMDHYDTRLRDFAVFVSGKIEAENERYITGIFSTWNIKKAGPISHKTPELEPTRQQVDKKESVQSSIRTGRRSVVRKHPEYVEAIFVSHILGGYFGSRLMKNIREEKGLTYGIYASLHPLQFGSYLVIGADVDSENIRLTFQEIQKELKRLRTDEVSFDELETARNHFIGSLQSEITTPFAHADKLKTIYLNDLPSNYYQEMIERIGRIDAGRILQISSEHFHEKDFSEIAVG
jgi:predicted Zn-dependent peptidase